MAEFNLVSVNVGRIQDHDGWTTAFFKAPVEGRVWVSKTHVEGDEQKHKRYHGGVFRPILAYCAQHYAAWATELGRELPYGGFAENFTLAGELDENTVCLGDVYRVGDTLTVQVSQPRTPCNQISQRWDILDLTKNVEKTGRTGWYMSVQQEGYAEAGMEMTLLERPHPDWTIETVRKIYKNRSRKPDAARALAECEALETGWRERLQKAAEK